MATQSDKNKPEVQAKVSWSNLLTKSTAATEDSHDAKELPLSAPEELICDMPLPGYDIRLVDRFLSSDECGRLIKAAEAVGFGYTNYPKMYRGNLRLIAFDDDLSKSLWPRIAHLLPATLTEGRHTYEAIGLNECWRLAKYYSGDQFRSHVDVYYRSDDSLLKSMYTANIYMNGDFTGGATVFEPFRNSGEELLRVSPSAGLCLLFRQPPSASYSHCGLAVEEGTKYLFRSDVMYRRVDT